MMNRTVILGKLNPFGGKKQIIVKDQQVPDIMTAMLNAHKIYAHEYDKISSDFFTGDGISTAKNIFGFLKKNIKYKIDSEANQQIMSPSGILSIGKNDCKNYALFIMGVLDSLKRKGLINNDIYFRFASYKMFDEMPHHVFAVIRDKEGTEFFIDPVLDSFNNRRMYFHKIDKRPNMAMYSVSGVDQIGLFGSAKKKAASKAAASAAAPIQVTATTTNVAPVAASAATAAKPKKKIVLKIGLAPARGAFLLLVGLNFMGLATKLKNSFTTHAGATENWWKNLGGNPNELLRKVNQGSVKKRLLGADCYFSSEGQMGVVPAAGAAAVTAAPILIKVGEFLKSIGIDPKEIVEAGKEVLAKQIKSAVDKNLTAQEQQEMSADADVNKVVDQALEDQKSTTNYLPYILGGGIALIIITQMGKKK